MIDCVSTFVAELTCLIINLDCGFSIRAGSLLEATKLSKLGISINIFVWYPRIIHSQRNQFLITDLV